MQFYVRFTVVKTFMPKVVKVLWCLYAVSFAIFIPAIFIDSVRFLGPYAVCCCFFAGITQNMIDRYKKIGECALTDQEIIVASGEEITKYSLSVITDLKLYYGGYVGKEIGTAWRYRGMKMPELSDGARNELVFLYEEEEVRIGLMFYQQHLGAVNTLLEMWERQGIICEVYGRKTGKKRFRV